MWAILFFNFSGLLRRPVFTYVTHARIHSGNQSVLSNEGNVYCSMKQRESLMGIELENTFIRKSIYYFHIVSLRLITVYRYLLFVFELFCNHGNNNNTRVYYDTPAYPWRSLTVFDCLLFTVSFFMHELDSI